MALSEIFVIWPFLVALLIPLAYGMKKRRELKAIVSIAVCSIGVVFFYPLVSYLSSVIPFFGYTIGKVVLFVLLPVLTVLYIERWKVREVFSRLGVRRKGLPRSVAYGVIAAVATIVITLVIILNQPSSFHLAYRTLMFFESFTEEFFFRGFLFLYLLSKTNARVAFATSIIGFILLHPQNFSNLFIISTAAQGILMAVVAHKTKNIAGCWIGHGLNRFFPSLIKTLI